jgi:hypothetical protein
MGTTCDAIRSDREFSRWALASACAVAIVFACAGPSRATDITACSTTVAAGDTGVLQTDVVCMDDFFGVRLLAGSTLRLNGHSITGSAGTFATVLGVSSVDDAEPEEGGHGRFTIEGPGEIAGAGPSPLFFSTTRACVTLQDGRATITSPTGVIDIHGCTFGIVGYILQYNDNRARATIDHVILHDNSLEGVTVRKLTASDVTAYNNGGAGVHAISTLVANNIVAYANHGQGLYGGRTVKASNVVTTGNYAGVGSERSVMLTNVDASDNVYLFGIQAKRAKLTDSIVTGNPLADIATASPPRLVNTTCGTSYDTATQTPWGVCADD